MKIYITDYSTPNIKLLLFFASNTESVKCILTVKKTSLMSISYLLEAAPTKLLVATVTRQSQDTSIPSINAGSNSWHIARSYGIVLWYI